ncbi:hypothetical protein BVRB_038980, partial [Beta vulgaris subsp. vulgaris]
HVNNISYHFFAVSVIERDHKTLAFYGLGVSGSFYKCFGDCVLAGDYSNFQSYFFCWCDSFFNLYVAEEEHDCPGCCCFETTVPPASSWVATSLQMPAAAFSAKPSTPATGLLTQTSPKPSVPAATFLLTTMPGSSFSTSPLMTTSVSPPATHSSTTTSKMSTTTPPAVTSSVAGSSSAISSPLVTTTAHSATSSAPSA